MGLGTKILKIGPEMPILEDWIKPKKCTTKKGYPFSLIWDSANYKANYKAAER